MLLPLITFSALELFILLDVFCPTAFDPIAIASRFFLFKALSKQS